MRPDLDVERATVMLTSTLLFVCKLYPTFEVTDDYCVGLVDDLLRRRREQSGSSAAGRRGIEARGSPPVSALRPVHPVRARTRPPGRPHRRRRTLRRR
jgi:hypothetical protein